MKLTNKTVKHAVTSLIGLFLIQSNVTAQIVSLGAANEFAVLAETAVTNTGASAIDGDLGVGEGAAIVGFGPTTGSVSGDTHNNNLTATLALDDAQLAYDALGMLTTTSAAHNLTGSDLGGKTLTSGVYEFSSTAALTGNLILDGPGDFVFKIGTTLGSSAASQVFLINGAHSANVFFKVGTATTLGAGTNFAGTIISGTAITSGAGNVIDGRLIALSALTMDNNAISTPALSISAVPEPSSTALLGLGALGFILRRRR